MSKIKTIAVLGIGGVGGYYGGMLAKKYSNSEKHKVIFIARGENEKAIRQNGLKLIANDTEQIIRPSVISSNASTIGPVDVLLCCVKSYHLESAIESVKNCIDKNTVIIPFLNGVSATERIQKMLPGTDVWDGCVYIVSKLDAPGIVTTSGKLNEMYFAPSNNIDSPDMRSLFTEAGINLLPTDDIARKVWEKFVFLSPLATSTTYYDLTTGNILNDPEKKGMLLKLVSEVIEVSRAKNIPFKNDIYQSTVSKIESLPFEATSSMHRDYKKGGAYELDSLTEYVIDQGKKYNIATPTYNKLLAGIISNRK